MSLCIQTFQAPCPPVQAWICGQVTCAGSDWLRTELAHSGECRVWGQARQEAEARARESSRLPNAFELCPVGRTWGGGIKRAHLFLLVPPTLVLIGGVKPISHTPSW